MAETWWIIAGNVAAVATVVATALALYGIVSTWLTRPRVKLRIDGDNHLDPSFARTDATIVLANEGRSQSLRNVSYAYAATKDGKPEFGDGVVPWVTEWPAGYWRRIHIYDPEVLHFGGEAREEEERLILPAKHGVVLDLRWGGPMAPWRRVRRIIQWTEADRDAGLPPVVVKGRRGRRAWAHARAMNSSPQDEK